MNHYVVQEFLSVLLVIAVATGTFLGFALSFVLLQEGMRQAVRWVMDFAVMHFASLSATDRWLRRTAGRSALR
jgi:hypothetical protein